RRASAPWARADRDRSAPLRGRGDGDATAAAAAGSHGPTAPGDRRHGAADPAAGLVRGTGGGGAMKPRSATSPPMDLDVTRERLTKLGLLHAAEQLATWLSEAVAEETPPHRFLDRMLEHELRVRDERRVR